MPPHLTSADAVAIYQLSASRNNTKLIAEKFGVSRRAVYDIWNRVSWVPETLPYWSEQHRRAYTAGAPPDKTRRAITIDEAVAIYKARPHPAHMRSAARPLAATLGVRPKTVTDVWNHVTWTSATAPYRPAAPTPAASPPPPPPISPA